MQQVMDQIREIGRTTTKVPKVTPSVLPVVVLGQAVYPPSGASVVEGTNPSASGREVLQPCIIVITRDPIRRLTVY
jgi:hypothetical protein